MHAITFRFEIYRCQALTYQGKLPGVIIHNPSFVTRKEKYKKNCTPFSHDIPRGESTCLILTMRYDNIMTMLRLKKNCIIP
jgi:hypothetical protein